MASQWMFGGFGGNPQPSNPPQHTRPVKACVAKVANMVNDAEARRLVGKFGLAIQSVTWEDCARFKNSAWGPCISDMTLQVDQTRMPVIRYPNFSDKTWDVPMGSIPILVGNEKNGRALKLVSLQTYLQNFGKYLNKPVFGVNSLFNPFRDSHVIVSAQACFLPIPQGKQTKFNVALFNYQSRPGDPAVLTIVSTSKGTSAQIISGNQQKLLFNNRGIKADFVGQRLSDNRRDRGVAPGGAMSAKEKKDNIVMIIQVPLRQKQISQQPQWGSMDGFGGFGGAQQAVNESSNAFGYGAARSVNVEPAIVKVANRDDVMCKCSAPMLKMPATRAYPGQGSSHVVCDECHANVKGSTIVYHCPKGRTWQHGDGYDICERCAKKQLQFDELEGINIERDPNYPVRVTLQYYKSTDNGAVNDTVITEIASLILSSFGKADFISSLVTDGWTFRPTESVAPRMAPLIPAPREGPGSAPGEIIFPADPVPVPAPVIPKPADVVQQPSQPINPAAKEDEYSLIRSILTGLKLDKFISVFVENEVTDVDFLTLTDDDLKCMIDKVGPRSRLRKKLEEMREQQKSNPGAGAGAQSPVLASSLS